MIKFTTVNIVTNIFTYLKEVRGELKMVVWPKKDTIIRLTLIVLIFSGIVALYLGLLDFAFTKLLEYLVSRYNIKCN